MNAHPIAEIFPMMGQGELKDLADDIAASGLLESIIMHEGKVLDGRNRLAACESVDVTPEFAEFDGDDPLEWVLSKNLHRRHLSESQRAMVAAKLANLDNGQRSSSANLPSCPTTQKEAAEKMQVSTRSVTAAKKVQTDGVPELASAVEAGNVSVSKAAEIAKQSAQEQADALRNGFKTPEVVVEFDETPATSTANLTPQEQRAKEAMEIIDTIDPTTEDGEDALWEIAKHLKGVLGIKTGSQEEVEA